MKKDLKDTTFIIPVRIESDDRLRNVITICCFLLENFDTKVILKEVDKESVFQKEALPQITEYVEDAIENLTHIHEVPDPDDPVFYRMRYLNEMLNMVETEVVVNYDSDVLLPHSSYIQAQDLCKNEYDLIYPYGQGNWQYQIFADDDLVSEFLSNDCDLTLLQKKSKIYDAQSGHVQFFRTSSYREGGMENENFRSWGPEDKERLHRFITLGYNIGRIKDWVYHLEHTRGNTDWVGNPYLRDNTILWEFLQSLNKEQLQQYYKEQKYLKKYK
tara:strand:- start:77 stop:895 length:819 start_codon:yes stop_codon:yes gene_type:complete